MQPMKRRHVLAVLGLSYVTLGVYTLYWLYRTRRDLLPFLPEKKEIPRLLILLLPWLVVAGLVLTMAIISATISTLSGDATSSENWLVAMSVIVVIIGFVAGVVVGFWWFYRYFTALEKVVQGTDAMLLYTLWIVLTWFGLGPIWILIVQGDINKFIDNGYRPLKAPIVPAYAAMPTDQQAWQQPQPPYPYQQPMQPPAPQSHPGYPPQQPAPDAAHHQPHQHHQPEHHSHPHPQGHEHSNQDHEQQPPQPYQG